MKSPHVLLVALLVLTTLGGAGLAWKQYQELIELRAAALNGDERADLQKRLWAAEKRAKDLADQLAALRAHGTDSTNAAESVAGDTPADTANPRGNRRQRGPGGNIMALMQSPEVQKLLAVQQKTQLDTRYAALFKSLNLPPDQLEKFKNLLVERQTSMLDVMTAAREQGIDPRNDREGLRTLMASAQADIDASIKTAIGDSAYSQYKNYEQTAPQRSTVNQLQQSLSYTATPLTGDQADKLVQILATHPATSPTAAAAGQPQPTGGNGGGGGRIAFGGGGGIGGVMGFGQQTVPITNETITASQGVLSAPQVAALQQLQQSQQAQQQVGQLIRQGQNANQTGGDTNPGGTKTTAPTKKNAKGG